MATIVPLATIPLADPKVDKVQIDSLVVMKIVKHVDIEFYSGMSEVAGETCQGILTGLISPDDRRLEVTNCFPTPRPETLLEGDENNPAAVSAADDKNTEILDMLKRFRNMNIDYELVGFYQAHLYGACYTQDMIESLVDYQANTHDGVVIVYDPIKTRQGQLCIRAFRLSKKALEMSVNSDWSPEAMKQYGLSFSTVLEELPVVMKNSHLMNVMLAELSLLRRKREAPHLELGTRRALEKSMRSLMQQVDETNKSLNAYTKFVVEKSRFDTQYAGIIAKRQTENEVRIKNGEPPLPLDDLKKIYKYPQLQTKTGMLEIFLNARSTEAYADYATQITGQNIAKLFVSETISGVGDSTDKERTTSTSRA
ncbi:JAB1/Mov34/MPN/PAD-1 ubiquitin protease domain-containing protein [Ditylenchus destructor]|nr:JAB1/Mov34/MPN/PAD-1 ubiquitin protease domain-containing protein [Ditylenchus destructor]